MKKNITYKDAGVDIKKADEAIALAKNEIKETFNEKVLSSIGGFGSMYSLKDLVKNYEDPSGKTCHKQSNTQGKKYCYYFLRKD